MDPVLKSIDPETPIEAPPECRDRSPLAPEVAVADDKIIVPLFADEEPPLPMLMLPPLPAPLKPAPMYTDPLEVVVEAPVVRNKSPDADAADAPEVTTTSPLAEFVDDALLTETTPVAPDADEPETMVTSPPETLPRPPISERMPPFPLLDSPAVSMIQVGQW